MKKRLKEIIKRNKYLYGLCSKCSNIIKSVFNKQYKEVRHFYKSGGPEMTESCSILNENSIVFELGGYKGHWTKAIYEKYHCFLYVFEPIKEFCDVMENAFRDLHKIHVYNMGIGVKTLDSLINVSADGSSIYDKGASETIKIKSLEEFCKENSIEIIDFMQINIEGGEYDILEWLIESGNIKRIHVLQIQFHNRKELNSKQRMRSIQKELEKTHVLEWAFRPYVWDRWRLK